MTALALSRISPPDTLGIIGRSASIARVREEIASYAPRNATVVITGETGTGKELVARALHLLGRDPQAPFVTANAAAFHPQLLGSELFGHEKGAFTGAIRPHKGLFEQADHGTLFLDEVGELPLDVQALLLRLLETGELRPLGSERVHEVTVRLIVATHRDLEAMVRQGRFRSDLYFRLLMLTIAVPPLRQRVEDLPLLADHLLERLRSEVGERSLYPKAMVPLSRYAWPGNVRQLLNVLRRAAIRSDTTTIDEDAIREALAIEPPAFDLCAQGALAATIEDVLRASDGRIAPAAKKLGIARSTLRSHIRRFGITTAG